MGPSQGGLGRRLPAQRLELGCWLAGWLASPTAGLLACWQAPPRPSLHGGGETASQAVTQPRGLIDHLGPVAFFKIF